MNNIIISTGFFKKVTQPKLHDNIFKEKKEKTKTLDKPEVIDKNRDPALRK